MFPLYDDNPIRRFPIVNVCIILANIIVFAWQCWQPDFEMFVSRYGLTPSHFTQHYNLSQLFCLLSYMYMHADIGHILGNLWFLHIFGDNVEDRIGRFNYLLFYTICGIVAGLGFVLFFPHTHLVLIGASGAIAGVLGAYLMLYPHASVRTYVTWFWYPRVPAWLIMLLWFAFNCVSCMFFDPAMGGVAVHSHVAGFVCGSILVQFFKRVGAFQDEKDKALTDSDEVRALSSRYHHSWEQDNNSGLIFSAAFLAIIGVSLFYAERGMSQVFRKQAAPVEHIVPAPSSKPMKHKLVPVSGQHSKHRAHHAREHLGIGKN